MKTERRDLSVFIAAGVIGVGQISTGGGKEDTLKEISDSGSSASICTHQSRRSLWFPVQHCTDTLLTTPIRKFDVYPIHVVFHFSIDGWSIARKTLRRSAQLLESYSKFCSIIILVFKFQLGDGGSLNSLCSSYMSKMLGKCSKNRELAKNEDD